MADERKLGDVATRLLMENDRVRIWEMALEPGQASDLHRHDLDYVLVQVAGDKIAGVFDVETGGAYPPGTVEGDVAPGQAMYIEKGGVETAKNTGTKPYHEILIELK
jgi:predicted metal-dependent enzyme (double-stranded beta helix superfamily)